MTILSVFAIIMMLLGLFFFLAGTIGLLRLPDFYSRLHAAGKCDSLAAVRMIIGMAAYNLESFSFGARKTKMIRPHCRPSGIGISYI